jgi:hypothetical protein
MKIIHEETGTKLKQHKYLASINHFSTCVTPNLAYGFGELILLKKAPAWRLKPNDFNFTSAIAAVKKFSWFPMKLYPEVSPIVNLVFNPNS